MAIGVSGEGLAEEGQQPADYLQLGENQSTSEMLLQFSLDSERIMSEAELHLTCAMHFVKL